MILLVDVNVLSHSGHECMRSFPKFLISCQPWFSSSFSSSPLKWSAQLPSTLLSENNAKGLLALPFCLSSPIWWNRAASNSNTTQGPSWGYSKVNSDRFSGNVGDSPQMLTKTSQWLQERASDTPTKGPLWLEQELHHQTQDIN